MKRPINADRMNMVVDRKQTDHFAPTRVYPTDTCLKGSCSRLKTRLSFRFRRLKQLERLRENHAFFSDLYICDILYVY